MRIFSYLLPGAVALLGCGDGGGDTSTGGGGSGGTTATGGSGGTTATGGGGSGGTTATGGSGGSGGTTTTGGGGSGGSGGSGGGGTVAEGKPCGQSANGATCQTGLVCCYPCGIPDCEFLCTVPCEAGSPGCSDNGCLLLP